MGILIFTAGLFTGFLLGVVIISIFVVGKQRNDLVGRVVRKKGEKEERLILEQSTHRVWFRDIHATIPQLLSDYEIKDHSGNWTQIKRRN